jgi:hypothetical protein
MTSLENRKQKKLFGGHTSLKAWKNVFGVCSKVTDEKWMMKTNLS